MSAVATPTSSAAGTSSPTPPSSLRVALVLGCLVALTVIGSSAVAVALPEVGRDLDLSTAGRAWVLAVFTLAFSVSTAAFGRLGDVLGLRTPLLVGGTVLGVGSILAAAAQSGELLLAARVVQGVGAGAVPVLVTGVVAAVVPKAERGAAFGAITAVVTVVSGSGPFLGGALTAAVSWRAVVAVPALALLLLVPAARLAPREPADAGGRVDTAGLTLVGLVAVGVVVALQAPATGLGAGVSTAAAGVAVVALLGVVARHRRAAARAGDDAPREVFPARELAGRGVFLLLCFSALPLLAAYLGLLFAVPEVLGVQRGWDPLEIGLALLPAAAVGATASRLLGARAVRLGRLRLVVGAGLLSAAGLLLGAAGTDVPVLLVVGFACVSASFGAGQAALLDTLPLVVPEESVGSAFGLFNLIFFTGGAVGAGLGGRAGGAARHRPVRWPASRSCRSGARRWRSRRADASSPRGCRRARAGPAAGAGGARTRRAGGSAAHCAVVRPSSRLDLLARLPHLPAGVAEEAETGLLVHASLCLARRTPGEARRTGSWTPYLQPSVLPSGWDVRPLLADTEHVGPGEVRGGGRDRRPRGAGPPGLGWVAGRCSGCWRTAWRWARASCSASTGRADRPGRTAAACPRATRSGWPATRVAAALVGRRVVRSELRVPRHATTRAGGLDRRLVRAARQAHARPPHPPRRGRG